MNLKQTATIVTTGGALAAWLAGTAMPTHAPAPLPTVDRAPIEARSAALATEVARLHDHLTPTASPRQPGRNLFRFQLAPARAAVAAVAPAAPAIETPAPPTLVPMRLVGVGEDQGADGPKRIAFISTEGQLFSVKEGESVANYRVIKISADVVELTDVNDGTVRRLALR